MEITENREEKKSFFKGWAGVLVLLVAAVLVVVALLNFSEIFNAVQGRLEAWKYQRLVDKMTAPYKNDKYGGKTPEETFDLFLDALRREDVDLASKYFVIKKQEGWKKSFGKLKEANLYRNMLSELEYARLNWKGKTEENEAKFSYSVDVKEKQTLTLPDGSKSEFLPGKYGAEIIFEKYPSGVWKISEL